MTPRDPNDVVRLISAPTAVQAHIWEQALRDEGIDAKVVGDYLGAGLGDIANFMPEIWVHRNDLEAAKAVLERHQQSAPEPNADEEA